jgi:hypothetical protein
MPATADAEPAGRSRHSSSSPDRAVWLHGVVRRLDPGRLTALSAMDSGTPTAIRAGDVTAVVSEVPLAEYDDEALRQNLEDLVWLERAARAHHGVVDALSRGGPVIPARLATVYRDRDAVAQMLAERRADFVAALDRVDGRVELGVKAYVVPVDADAAVDEGSGGPGTAYLRKRRAQLTRRDESQRVAAQSAVEVHAALSERAEAARRHAPQDRRLSGEDTEMVLNGAYLVRESDVGEFAALLEALSRRHPPVRLRLTGPWPPYSFAGQAPQAQSQAQSQAPPQAPPQAGDQDR